jgi:nitronate monooxygenase
VASPAVRSPRLETAAPDQPGRSTHPTSPAWCARIGLRHPVVQTGMGGDLAGSELAGAVSAAGGLGTLGLGSPERFAADLHALRTRRPELPVAANLLVPFVRAAHVDACLRERPPVVTLFYGFDAGIVRRLHEAGIWVLHQVGGVDQARRALRDGADGLIAQGEEAGGHLAGDRPLAELLPAVRSLATGRPVLAAGGIHDAETAHRARGLGADGVVAGTRFLLTPEAGAHPEYQARLLAAADTLRTSLFGLGWPAPHRVVPNAATGRWCTRDPDGPRWARAIDALLVPTRRLAPMDGVGRMVARQRLGLPLYLPVPLSREMDARLADVTPLYAGRCVGAIDRLRPAAEVVAELAAGFAG